MFKNKEFNSMMLDNIWLSKTYIKKYNIFYSKVLDETDKYYIGFSGNLNISNSIINVNDMKFEQPKILFNGSYEYCKYLYVNILQLKSVKGYFTDKRTLENIEKIICLIK